MVSGIFRMVIWNETIPDALRGRLAGIEQVSYSIGPALGSVEAGGVASVFSVQTSIVSRRRVLRARFGRPRPRAPRVPPLRRARHAAPATSALAR